MKYALEELKLPAILAVHIALNTETELTTLQKPEVGASQPVTLAMLGRPGVGKSYISAMLSEYEILNFDSVSGHSSLQYRDFLLSKVGKDNMQNLSVGEGWKLVNEAKNEFNKNEKLKSKTLRNMLDEATDRVLSDTKRSKLYICDMPGMPGEYNFGSGRTHGKNRIYDVVDFFAWESCESSLLSTHQLTDYTMSNKLKFVREDVIANNIEHWKTIRNNFSNSINDLLG